MKRTLLLLLLSLSIIFSLLSCGGDEVTCTEHVDSDANGKCDVCDATVEPNTGNEGGGNESADIVLVKDGDALFSVLVASNASNTIRDYANELIQEFNKYYIEDKDVVMSYDNAELDPGTEIVIGPVTTRGDKFNVDTHYLGYEGFAIKAVDGNIFVIAGGNTGYRKAIDYLKKNILKLNDYDDCITNLTISGDTAYESIQTGYTIESITINANNISEYVIAYGDTLKDEKTVATALQDQLYKNTGVWLETVKISKLASGQKAIYIEYTGEDKSRTTESGFVIYVDEDSNMHVECEFSNVFNNKDNVFDTTVESTVTSVIMPKNKKNVTLSTGTVKEVDVRNVSYEIFGAKGDGETNDFAALNSCHEYANTYGHTVNAKNGHTYRITETGGKVITIQTNVKWNGASFIIDDSKVGKDDPERGGSIFQVKSDYKAETYKAGDGTAIGNIIDAINQAGGIDRETTTKLDLGLGYAAIIVVYNEKHECYIRHGSHYEGGEAQHEIICIDENGNIDPDTPFMFDYAEVTKIEVRRADDKAITIDGGGATFTTVANQVPFEWNGSSPVYYYYARNIRIDRSNTVLKNVNHLVTGERDDCGAPYNGFIVITYTNNVTVKDCVVTGRKNYNNMGSYDINPSNSNNTLFLNVTQTNFFLEDGKSLSRENGYWSVMSSNYCKNLTYDGCFLNRFDAHMGVYNATIRNSSVGILSLIGAGALTVENTTIYTGNTAQLVSLRSDYGANWEGTFTFKDVTAVYNGNSGSFSIIGGEWYNHYFGYACYAPETIILDGFEVVSANVNTIQLATGGIALSNISDETYGGAKNENPYSFTKKLTIKNNTKNYTYIIPTGSKTEVTYE